MKAFATNLIITAKTDKLDKAYAYAADKTATDKRPILGYSLL